MIVSGRAVVAVLEVVRIRRTVESAHDDAFARHTIPKSMWWFCVRNTDTPASSSGFSGAYSMLMLYTNSLCTCRRPTKVCPVGAEFSSKPVRLSSDGSSRKVFSCPEGEIVYAVASGIRQCAKCSGSVDPGAKSILSGVVMKALASLLVAVRFWKDRRSHPSPLICGRSGRIGPSIMPDTF